jgi:hypothetical protein
MATWGIHANVAVVAYLASQPSLNALIARPSLMPTMLPVPSSHADGVASPADLSASMELAFRNRKLRTLCQDHDEAVSVMGESAAEVLRTRIADLRAVTYLAELPAGRPAVVDGDQPQLHFGLRAGWSLLMTVGHQTVPRTERGDLDQTRVRRARVEEITR